MSLLLLFGATQTLPGVNVSLNQTLGALASSAAVQVVDTATLSKILDPLTLSAQVTVGGDVNAVLNKTLGGLTLNSSVTVTDTATVDATLGALTLTATGFTGDVSAVLDSILGALSLVSTATSGVQVPAPVVLKNETLLAAGSINHTVAPRAISSYVNGQPIPARSTAFYIVQLVDADGMGVPREAMTALTLTLYDKGTGAVVNDIDGLDVLNTGRGAIDEDGNLTISFLPEDMAIVGDVLTGAVQYRSMVLDWKYNSNVLLGRHQMEFGVVALAEV